MSNAADSIRNVSWAVVRDGAERAMSIAATSTCT